MKSSPFLIILIFFFHSFTAQSQIMPIWPEIGITGSYGYYTLQNRGLLGNGNHLATIEPNTNYGFRLGLNSGKTLGIMFERTYYTFNSTYDHIYLRTNEMILETGNYMQTLSFSGQRTLYLIKFRGSRGHFEFGGGTMTMREFQREFSRPNNKNLSDNILKSTSIIGQIGATRFIFANDYCTLNSGIRAVFGLSDILNSEGKAQFFPSYTQEAAGFNTVPLSLEINAEFSLDFGWIYKKIKALQDINCRKKEGIINVGEVENSIYRR